MSKLGKLGSFFKKVGKVAPIIMAFTPLAPFAPIVTAAIQEAEAIKGATGPEKLAHVVNIVEQAATAAQAAGKSVNPDEVKAAATTVVSGIVQTVNALDGDD